MATTAGEPQTRPSTISYVLGGLALAALLAMSIWFFATGLMAPLWAVIGFIAVWVVLVVLGCCVDSPASLARAAAAGDCCCHPVRRPARRSGAARLDADDGLQCLRRRLTGTSKAGEEVLPMNRGIIGTIIGVLVIIILVIVILQLT